jgi:hypothetical protein
MQRCKFCRTRVAADATRCWLCHAGVDADSVQEGPDDLAFLPHPAHVWSGPLARAPVVLKDPNAVRRAAFSRWHAGALAFRGETRLLITLIVVLMAVAPYAATGSRTVLLLFGAPFGLMAMWTLKHVWRRARVG